MIRSVAFVFLALTFLGIAQTGRLTVPAEVQERKLMRRPAPVYPPLAQAARIQGTVKFAVLIAGDGTVKWIRLLSGHPLLVRAAMDAVKQWQYRPTERNGIAMEVLTTVSLTFSLTNHPPHPTRV